MCQKPAARSLLCYASFHVKKARHISNNLSVDMVGRSLNKSLTEEACKLQFADREIRFVCLARLSASRCCSNAACKSHTGSCGLTVRLKDEVAETLMSSSLRPAGKGINTMCLRTL